MGSLTDLNTFAQTTVEYSDARDPNVIVDPPTASNPLQTLEGQQFDILTTIDVVEVIAYEDCDPTYIIEVPVPGATLAWDDFPVECTVVQDGLIWTVTGMQDAEMWYRIKSPTVTVPSSFQGSLSYEVTLRWTTLSGIENRNWTVGVYIPVVSMTATTGITVDALKVKGVGAIPMESTTILLTTANISIIDFLVAGATADFDYTPGVATALGSSAPQLSGIGQGLTEYTVEVTCPDNILDSFTMIDGASYNFSYNAGTKTATFSGLATELDTALQNLQPIISDDPIYYYIFTQLDFSMTNSLDAAVDTFTLPLKSTNETHLTFPTIESYTINTPATITGAPKIPSAVSDTDVFIMTIEPNDAAQIDSLTGQIITGSGIAVGERVFTSAVGANNFSGQQVAISETGTYLAVAGRNNHRIYIDTGSGYTLQKTYNEDDYSDSFETEAKNDAFAISSNGVYLAFKTRGSSQDTVYIETRSGTTWSNQHSFTVSGSTGPVESLRFDKTGTKLAVATDDGNFTVYTRSGSTWSSSFSVTTGFSDFGAFDMDPSGTRYAISEAPVFGGDTTVKIYNGSTLEHEFEMTDRVDIALYPQSTRQPTSLSFDDGANTLAIIGEDLDITILERSGTAWTRNETFNAYDDAAGADSSFYPRCKISWSGDTLIAVGQRYDNSQLRYEAYVDLYLKQPDGSWDFSSRGQNSVDTTDAAFISMPAVISGDASRFGYGLPDTSGSTNYGAVTLFAATYYGRFETATKQLTVVGDKAAFNSAVDGFTLTPATDESDTINLNYVITYPNSDVAVRNQKVE